jgi:hypothetical protein
LNCLTIVGDGDGEDWRGWRRCLKSKFNAKENSVHKQSQSVGAKANSNAPPPSLPLPAIVTLVLDLHVVDVDVLPSLKSNQYLGAQRR